MPKYHRRSAIRSAIDPSRTRTSPAQRALPAGATRAARRGRAQRAGGCGRHTVSLSLTRVKGQRITAGWMDGRTTEGSILTGYYFYFFFFVFFFLLSAAPPSSYFHGYFARARLTCSGRGEEGRQSAKGRQQQVAGKSIAMPRHANRCKRACKRWHASACITRRVRTISVAPLSYSTVCLRCFLLYEVTFPARQASSSSSTCCTSTRLPTCSAATQCAEQIGRRASMSNVARGAQPPGSAGRGRGRYHRGQEGAQ